MIEIMSQELIEQLLAKEKRHRPLARGGYLFHRGDTVRFIFILDEGEIELVRPQPDGTSVVLHRAAGRMVFAEASLYSDIYHCDAIAVSACRVFALSKPVLLKQLHDDPAFSHLWAAHLAREVQAARFRSEILTRKTVSERLDAWLGLPGNGLPPRGEWKTVAAHIGVSPEALYRELSRRRSGLKTR